MFLKKNMAVYHVDVEICEWRKDIAVFRVPTFFRANDSLYVAAF